jgi:hypothetical protein
LRRNTAGFCELATLALSHTADITGNARALDANREITMPFYVIHINGKAHIYAHSQEDEFLAMIESKVKRGMGFIVSIAKTADHVAIEIRKILAKYGIKMDITTDSNPKAVGYFVNAMAAGTLGAISGAYAGTVLHVGFMAWKTYIASDFVLPGIGQCIAIAAAIGAILGAVAGTAGTHYGLRIQFSKVRKSYMDVNFIPVNQE